MKTKLPFLVIGMLIGLAVGGIAGFEVQKICSIFSRQDSGIIIRCQKGVNLMAIWKNNFLDFSFCQEGGNAGIVPAEVVFHDNSKMWYWIINNTFFMDFNRDGIADARVETAKRPKVCFIRQGDRWVECQDVFQNKRSAIDRQGKTLVFRDSWQ